MGARVKGSAGAGVRGRVVSMDGNKKWQIRNSKLEVMILSAGCEDLPFLDYWAFTAVRVSE